MGQPQRGGSICETQKAEASLNGEENGRPNATCAHAFDNLIWLSFDTFIRRMTPPLKPRAK
jgi:hypothetical protein